jgi:hypothetical protein
MECQIQGDPHAIVPVQLPHFGHVTSLNTRKPSFRDLRYRCVCFFILIDGSHQWRQVQRENTVLRHTLYVWQPTWKLARFAVCYPAIVSHLTLNQSRNAIDRFRISSLVYPKGLRNLQSSSLQSLGWGLSDDASTMRLLKVESGGGFSLIQLERDKMQPYAVLSDVRGETDK